LEIYIYQIFSQLAALCFEMGHVNEEHAVVQYVKGQIKEEDKNYIKKRTKGRGWK
jgi:hypothetical protein